MFRKLLSVLAVFGLLVLPVNADTAGRLRLATSIVAPPTGFDWAPLNLSRNGSTISTTFNVTSLRPTPTGTTYYVSNTGSNGANGLTPATAFKTIVFALGKADLGTLVLDESSGPFYGANGWRGTNPANTGAGGPILVTTRFGGQAQVIDSRNTSPQTWTLDSGSVYKSSTPTFTSSSTVGIDLGVLDTYGFPSMATAATSRGAMTQCSSYLDTGAQIVYAWACDSRSLIGDTNMVMSDTSNNMNWAPTVNGAVMYIEHVSFIGGARALRVLVNTPRVSVTLVENSDNEWGSLNSNLVAIQGGVYYYRQNSTTSGGNQDGLNYHGDGTGGGNVSAVEINEIAGRSGYDNSGTNNASTSHEFCRVISINGNYKTAQNRTIHDINSARRWMLGSHVGAPLVAGNSTVRADTNAIGWYDTDVIDHSSSNTADILTTGDNSTIFYSNTSIVGLTLSGNIRTYLGL